MSGGADKIQVVSDRGDEILEWDATNEEWKEMGKMKQSRHHGHAVAVVDVADVIDYCT